MVVSIASGKGGTGKTTIAVLLAKAIGNVTVLDCDVEEPNAHLFLQPKWKWQSKVTMSMPHFIGDNCGDCRICANSCVYNAIAVSASKPIIFPELCHGCCGCILACPQNKLVEIKREVGALQGGNCSKEYSSITVWQGELNIGLPHSTAVIRELKKKIASRQPTIIDCPPGTACSMVMAVQNSDIALLVTEPTPFGLHDLQAALAVIGELSIPVAIIINRYDDEAYAFTEKFQQLANKYSAPIIARLPNNRFFAEEYANGIIANQKYLEYAQDIWCYVQGARR